MDKPILFLNDAAKSESFTTTQGGGGEPRLPYRDRFAHVTSLIQKFDHIRNQLDYERQSRLAQSIPSRDGCYLEVLGQAGYDLAPNSLEDKRKGIRLISTGRTANDEIQSIVYIPNGQEQVLYKKLLDYADVDKKTEKGNPLNKVLVEGIENIGVALLEKFWQDPKSDFPQKVPVWCELWLRTENVNAIDIVSKTREICEAIGVETNHERLDFHERSVIVIRANQQQLMELLARSDNFAELRLAKEPVSFWSSMPNYEQTQAVDDLLQRISLQDKGISICILDSGINNGHRLLEPFCSDDENETYHPDWNPNDHIGHGTQMAGIAMFGDLQETLELRDQISINHRIFSGKILPPKNFPDNDAKLYGYITAQTISKVEIKIPERKQHYCLAITTIHDIDRAGRPSSWSAEIDKLAFGEEDGDQRLILISAGNATNIVSQQALIDYPDINKILPVQNPAQAWNALTIGAFTEKTRITDPDYSEYTPVAQHGELSPHSTTSLTWDAKRWPNKPDIVLEGGNLIKSPDGDVDSCDDLCILTTSHNPIIKQFELFDATSASTAKAAWMAAEIQSILPNAWPETIRALMVHSAEWTPQLIAQFGNELKTRGDIGTLLRIAGYEIPNLEKASYCSINHLTLIAQEHIKPFMVEGSQVKTNIMHFYELPWPREILQGLGNQLVTLKITLSYFIEPSPGELQTQNRYTYASHGLRFDINAPEEDNDIDSFKKRINKEAREDKEDKPDYDGLGSRWNIGTTYRNKGTVQSDSVTLTGAEMAVCNHIAVFPIGGWWKTRKSENCMDKTTRYSMVVSLHTDSQEIDIYTPVANAIKVQIPISY